MKKINLSSAEMLDDLIEAKFEIDNYRVSNHLIKQKTKLDTFILSLNLQNNIFVNGGGDEMLPFSYIKTDNETYFIYSGNDTTANTALEALSLCDYDPKNLMHKTNAQILEEDILELPHFLVNGEFYI